MRIGLGFRVPRILNLAEVEQGIRESAQQFANAPGAIEPLFAAAYNRASTVIWRDAKVRDVLPSSERSRLTWLWIEAYAEAMGARIAEEQDAERTLS